VFEIWKGRDIRYWDIAPKLFPDSYVQQIVPFLGAGVSVSEREPEEKLPSPVYPPTEVIQQVCTLLGLADEKSRTYIEYAIRAALWMRAWEATNGSLRSRTELEQKLKAEKYPPFGWELAELFSLLAPYRSIEDTALPAIQKQLLLPPEVASLGDKLIPMLVLFITTTKLASRTDPLTSISSRYEAGAERKDLWDKLQSIFANKKVPTETHRLIAEAARHHIEGSAVDDYLIVTTNYDCLVESALDEHQTPYAVLRRNHRDGKIYTRFYNMDPAEIARLEDFNEPQYPKNFQLRKGKRVLPIVYKMHGSLAPDLKDTEDGLVITDGDYVDFISASSDIVPSSIVFLMAGRRVLFLGYSFSDWNVRSIYETVIHKDGQEQQDYAVTLGLSKFEETYFRKRNIIVVLEGLREFVQGVRDCKAGSCK
jgi:hypothetical protein